mmetsp:Transcript_126550/g.393934  ORF Transcript_126550/g.393934 Transcript_126550/m.393934 type:complete len:223 (+) Transcript_126550:221-889(+)
MSRALPHGGRLGQGWHPLRVRQRRARVRSGGGLQNLPGPDHRQRAVEHDARVQGSALRAGGLRAGPVPLRSPRQGHRQGHLPHEPLREGTHGREHRRAQRQRRRAVDRVLQAQLLPGRHRLEVLGDGRHRPVGQPLLLAHDLPPEVRGGRCPRLELPRGSKRQRGPLGAGRLAGHAGASGGPLLGALRPVEPPGLVEGAARDRRGFSGHAAGEHLQEIHELR